jgi:gliding motility-associated-like protein
MKIEVLPAPNIELNHHEIICSGNNEWVQLNAGLLSGAQSQYNYEWSRNGLLMPLETGYYLKVKQDGTYTCLVTDKTSACTKTRTNTVIYSNEVTIKNVIISDLTANNTVTIIASGLDNTEYSLDNPNGPFQLSNTFENVEPGFHIVSVKDKNGCGVNSKNIAVVGAPLYFTPNNDGFNDYWKVKGINRLFFKNSKVVIYDRYGKILKVLPNAESEGWDGTFNGHPLPADDYWFVIDLEDGRSANGHFSLKR